MTEFFNVTQVIAEINANAGRGDRFVEKVYADWLDEQGDPRAEAWRVLLEAGKRPSPRNFFPDFSKKIPFRHC